MKNTYTKQEIFEDIKNIDETFTRMTKFSIKQSKKGDYVIKQRNNICSENAI